MNAVPSPVFFSKKLLKLSSILLRGRMRLWKKTMSWLAQETLYAPQTIYHVVEGKNHSPRVIAAIERAVAGPVFSAPKVAAKSFFEATEEADISDILTGKFSSLVRMLLALKGSTVLRLACDMDCSQSFLELLLKGRTTNASAWQSIERILGCPVVSNRPRAVKMILAEIAKLEGARNTNFPATALKTTRGASRPRATSMEGPPSLVLN